MVTTRDEDRARTFTRTAQRARRGKQLGCVPLAHQSEGQRVRSYRLPSRCLDVSLHSTRYWALSRYRFADLGVADVEELAVGVDPVDALDLTANRTSA